MRRARVLGGVATAAVTGIAVAALASAGPAGASPRAGGLSDAQVAHLAAGADQPVIVLFRDQFAALPATGTHQAARAAAIRSAQAGVTAELHAVHAKRLHGYSLINAVAATVSADEADRLAANPAVRAVVPDRQIKAPTQDRSAARAGQAAAVTAPPGACPADPKQPLLEPEALQLTRTAYANPATPQAQSLATGAGVKVAYVADGIDVNNPDFIRASGQHVIVDYKDFSGDGPNAPTEGAEAFGDASGIAAQGRQVYDLSNFVATAHPLPAKCTIRVLGMAPGASIVALKAFRTNSASTSAVVQAIDYAVTTDHVDVLNQSFGANPYPDDSTDPVSLADDAAVAAGTTVVSSSGDAGTTNTVGSPASDPNTIGVAASTDFRSYAQTTFGGFQLGSGRYVSNNISSLSSGGTTQQGRTPDVTAPGDLGWALCSPEPAVYLGCVNYRGAPARIQQFGGTSQSAPLTSGEAALVIQAYRDSHGGTRPSPALVKQIITSTATDLGHPTYEQGHGLINSLAAVRAAKSVRDSNGSPARSGSSLLLGPDQLTKTAAPGTATDLTATVTNVGNRTQVWRTRATVQGRPVSVVRGTTHINLNDTSAPAYVDPFGIPRTYVTVKFSVPSGVDRLDGSIAAPEPATASPLRLILLDPKGVYTAYSLPQGNGNFGHVDVRYPTGGTWTAVIAAAQGGGYSGPVHYDFASSKYVTLGRTSPGTLALVPGQSGKLTLHTATPAQPGTTNARLELVPLAGGGTRSVEPVTLTSTLQPHGTFSGTLTGGNGRGYPAQSQTYDVDVPAGLKDVGVGLTLGGNPNTTTYAYLVDPQGQVADSSSNVVSQDPDGNPVYGAGVQTYARAPRPGRWQFDLVTLNPIAGTAVSQPFTGRLRFDSVEATAAGVPNSASVVLPRGKPATATATLTNTGSAPLSVFADGRLNQSRTLPLAPVASATNLPFPDAVAQWSVPTETTRFTAQAKSTQKIQIDSYRVNDSGSGTGSSEMLGGVGTTSTVAQSAHPLGAGLWATIGSQVGPFTAPAPDGTVDFVSWVRSAPLDPAVSADTGDVWARSFDASAPAATPATVAPGKSGTVTVRITPTAASGTVVHGTLYVDAYDAATQSGTELAAVPYTYTVG